MKNSLLILAGAAALSLASCSQEKTTEVTTTTPAAETSAPAMSAADMDAMIQARAQRIADKMVADMKITDEATKTKIRTVYVDRAKRMTDMRSKYTTDTTGMAAAIREANAATDAEFKTIFTDPTQYQAYESSRNTYYSMEEEEPSMSSSDNMSSSDMSNGSDMSSSSDASMSSGSTSGSMSGTATNVDKMKMKGDDGKMKVKSDGDVKVKDAEGNKLKVAGDDGTVKMKPENGDKSKIK